MSINLKGRGSRESFRGLIRLLSEKLELTPRESERLHAFLNSLVFPDEVSQAITDHETELHP